MNYGMKALGITPLVVEEIRTGTWNSDPNRVLQGRGAPPSQRQETHNLLLLEELLTKEANFLILLVRQSSRGGTVLLCGGLFGGDGVLGLSELRVLGIDRLGFRSQRLDVSIFITEQGS